MSLFLDPLLFWLVLARLSGMLMMIPALSNVPIPGFVRAVLMMWLALLITPTLAPVGWQLGGAVDLFILVIFELLFGMGLGFIVRLAFASVEMAGTIMDTEVGFRIAEQINPQLAISGGVMARFMILSAMYYFWVMDYFSIMVLALRESFVLVPPVKLNSNPIEINQIIRFSAGMFLSAVMLAAPIMAVMFAITVGVGFLARAVQGINFFFEAFTLRIVVGVGAALFLLPLLLMILRNQFERLIPAMDTYLASLVGGTP